VGITIIARKHDRDLQNDVYDTLRETPRAAVENLAVSVADGQITLHGRVDTCVQKCAAEQAARRVPGVREVVNDIEVQLPAPQQRPDPEIAEAVRRVIEWHSQVPTGAIEGAVEDGWVILRGAVEAAYQRSCAEQSVQCLRGVRGVRNEIEVRGGVAQGEVRERVRAALERHATREAEDVNVTVDGSTVMLTGTVGARADRADIEAAVRGAPGVARVSNKLQVDDEPFVY
jgi:osmotically-inducible protein OsmY